jgi:cobyrinic acid a,c-diamide synthase
MLPRIIIAALKGGSGKTITSLGLAAAWLDKGLKVAPFKRGPDFIDASWLTLAARRPCYNLDSFMMTDSQIIQSFHSNSVETDISLIEGNRGLFDGLDQEGHYSTAALGKLLKIPIIIIVDVTMVTRTVAALVLGCQKFDPDLNIAGIILNRVAGPRQDSIVRNSIKHYCNIPVVGSIPKLKENLFPERHMGLIPHWERGQAERAITWAKSIAQDNLDIEALEKIARDSELVENADHVRQQAQADSPSKEPLRIGFIRDNAFWFYYPENLDQLKKLGAVLIEVDSMTDKQLPTLDALYIGGGFPETQAESLANNKSFRESLKESIEAGLPVYAECGGLMYLGKSLILNEKAYPMADALPLKFVLEKKPQGHGYTILEVTRPNPFYPVGEILKGHEFHYSKPLIREPEEIDTAFQVKRGRGLDGQRDGLYKKNLLATYTHVHAAGNTLWSQNLYNRALRVKHQKRHREILVEN